MLVFFDLWLIPKTVYYLNKLFAIICTVSMKYCNIVRPRIAQFIGLVRLELVMVVVLLCIELYCFMQDFRYSLQFASCLPIVIIIYVSVKDLFLFVRLNCVHPARKSYLCSIPCFEVTLN